MESVSCLICGAVDSELWAREDGYCLVKCCKCGLVYLNPRPSLNEIDHALRIGAHKTKKGILSNVGRYSKAKVKEFEHELVHLLSYDNLRQNPCRWLDIGAGFGELIKALSNICAPGSKLLGIDPSEPKVKKAQKLGIPIEAIPLSEVKGKFTHVSLINVLSHLPNPIEFLCDLRRLMEPCCKLILVTGNLGGLPRNEIPGSLYLPDHILFAGEENVKTILIEAGFKVTQLYRQKIKIIDNIFIGSVKNLVRRLTHRPPVPVRFPRKSNVRSLWYIAELIE